MDRVARAFLVAGLLLGAGELQAAVPSSIELQLVVDLDDDDGDGIADGEGAQVADAVDCARLDAAQLSGGLASVTPASGARVLLDGRAWPAAAAQRVSMQAPASGEVLIQALQPGLTVLQVGATTVRVRAIAITAVDGDGQPVSMASSHASMQRTAPERLESAFAVTRDPDALRFVLTGRAEDLPASVRLTSRSEKGAVLDTLAEVALVDAPCPGQAASGLACKSTWPIRVVGDAVDRAHPIVSDRSVRAELGGALLIDAGHGRRQQLRVGGPRKSRLGTIGRYRATLRARLMRVVPGGAAPVGRGDAAALSMVREQIALANSLWGQCGISFGPPEEADVALVDPPSASMVAVGCELGMPAAGGEVRLRVDGRPLSMTVRAGTTPSQAARQLERALQKAGFRVMVSPNARISPGALPSVDLLVRRKDGKQVELAGPAQGPVSTDATLGVCVGRAELSAGLRHFLDVDSMAGTFDERLLLKSMDDHDPSTIEVLVISAFARGGRIGESFIGNDRSSLRNTVVIDRAGIRVARASFTLAHEVGHVLLDVPGHPDDYGYDTPTLLMDSDGADLTAFGPRRLTVQECERVLEQAGEQATVPMVRAWRWGRLSKVPLRPTP